LLEENPMLVKFRIC